MYFFWDHKTILQVGQSHKYAVLKPVKFVLWFVIKCVYYHQETSGWFFNENKNDSLKPNLSRDILFQPLWVNLYLLL